MAVLTSNAYWIFRSTNRNGANGTEEAKKKRPEAGKAKYERLGHSWTPPPLPKGVETELMGLRKSRKRGRKPGMQSTGGWDIPEPPPPSPPKGSRNRANGTEEVKKKKRKPGMQSKGGWDIPDVHPTKKRIVCLTKIFLSCRRWEIAHCYFIQWYVILD